jgi:lactate permease
MVMNLVLAIIPVLLLIILMAFFKMSGDKSSVISLVVTMLIAFFGFHFPVNDLLSSFLYGALKAVSPILIIILMAIFSYNVLLKTEKMEIIKQQFSSISTDKSIQVLLLKLWQDLVRQWLYLRRFLSVSDSNRSFRQQSV